MSWRLANSLVTLRSQVNQRWPNRNKASDGTIGDAAHAAVKSEHNPNSAGVVTAIDITHDPANGADMQQLANELVVSNDQRIWYIIFNRRIWINGRWQTYTGTSDPHTNHLHLSTNQNAAIYDNGGTWSLGTNNSMPDKIDLSTARILGDGVLGRDGLGGRASSHDGGADKDYQANHVGKELTNAYVSGLFSSNEGKTFRDVRVKVYQERDQLKDSNSRMAAELLNLNIEKADLIKKLEIAQSSNPNSDATKWQQLKILIKALLS